MNGSPASTVAIGSAAEGIAARPSAARRVAQWIAHPSLLVGIILCVGIAILSIGAPIFTHYDPNLQNANAVFSKPSLHHLMGTDSSGRDVYTRVLYAGRTTIVASLLVVLLGAPVGSALGLISGYFRGVVAVVIMRFMDLLLAFPGILLALTVSAILGPGLFKGILAVAVVSVPAYARVVEGATAEVRSLPYVEAAITTGAGPVYIMRRHILPNVLAGIVVLATSWLGIAVLWVASLGYLGLGVQPPTAEWGAMLNDGQSYISVAWWISFFPGLFLSLFVVGTNLLGDGLRDRIDPTLGRKS